MERAPVASSVLATVGYSEPDSILEVEFQTGRVYRYLGVPLREYEALLRAPSVGRYFNTRIRTRYDAHEILE